MTRQYMVARWHHSDRQQHQAVEARRAGPLPYWKGPGAWPEDWYTTRARIVDRLLSSGWGGAYVTFYTMTVHTAKSEERMPGAFEGTVRETTTTTVTYHSAARIT